MMNITKMTFLLLALTSTFFAISGCQENARKPAEPMPPIMQQTGQIDRHMARLQIAPNRVLLWYRSDGHYPVTVQGGSVLESMPPQVRARLLADSSDYTLSVMELLPIEDALVPRWHAQLRQANVQWLEVADYAVAAAGVLVRPEVAGHWHQVAWDQVRFVGKESTYAKP